MDESALNGHEVVFEKVLDKAVQAMNSDVKKFGDDHFKKYTGVKMEPLLVEYLEVASKGTIFEGQIKEASEYAFPDIIAGSGFGIEVKTTDKDHWISTGNSILESSRISGVDNIYLFFAKLKKPIEFRYKKYDACLSDVVVTHYPRYQIDMNIPPGQTIFDKVGLPYVMVRQQANPAKQILEYYKRKAKGQENQLWWMNINEIENEVAAPPVIRFLSEVESKTREDLICKAYAYFPEIVGNSVTKYKRWASWLLIEKSIIVPNARDFFSAGGVSTLLVNDNTYEDVPRVMTNLHLRLDAVLKVVSSMTEYDMEKFWREKPHSGVAQLAHWRKMMTCHGNKTYKNVDCLMKDMVVL